MTIRKKLNMGIGVLMTLFLALGIISYFQIGQIDENLTEIIQGKALGKQAVSLHEQRKTLDAALTKKKDSQNTLFVRATENLQRIDDILGDLAHSGSDSQESDGHKRTLETSKIEVNIAEVADSLGTFLQIQNEEYKKRVLDRTSIVEQEFRKLRNLAPNKYERARTTKLESEFNGTKSLIEEIFAIGSYIQEDADELGNIRAEIDELLGEDFEVFSRADLQRVKETGRRMIGTKVIITLILILTGLLDVSVFSVAITRSITKPLTKLKDAMTEIGNGDFETRIEIESNDEIGQVADAFKQMAGQRKQAEEELREARDELEARVQERTAALVQANKGMESEIREREKAEHSLEKLNRDLESSVRELTRSNRELQEFSYVAAHDLKTPLRGIVTLAEWISTDYAEEFDEAGREQVSLLIGRTKQMNSLVDNILEYLSLGQDNPNEQEVDLNAALSEVIDDISPSDDIQIIVESELPTLVCKKKRIVQIFQNMLSNAIRHGSTHEGQIIVDCVNKGNFWEFSVADNGPGIDRKYFEKIFRIFQTLSPREQTESRGIGLSIVKKIVELNAGSIWVESEIGAGSTFFFTLPIQMTAQHAECQATDAAC
ncbi:MAG: ATP-binding protein [Planctomycetota bacterium]|nr:ATP-binding protein [Planctomycetota bacterium]